MLGSMRNEKKCHMEDVRAQGFLRSFWRIRNCEL